MFRRRRFLPIAAAVAFLAFPGSDLQALPATPRGAGTTTKRHVAVGASLGFPYLAVTGQYGIADRFDAGLNLRSAWGSMQRAGLEARVRLIDGPSSALAVRAAADAWFRRPAEPRWVELTGTQDVGASVAVLYSWATTRNTVITTEGSVQFIGNRQPKRPPLSGPPPWIAFGTNAGFRIGAEVPSPGGLVLGFDLGLDLHLSGFDAAYAMPSFSIGLGAML